MARRGTTPALGAHYSANPYYREYGAIGGDPIPLLAGAIRRGERVAIAIEARGLGPGIVRTYYRHPPLRAGRHRGCLCARGCEHSDSGGVLAARRPADLARPAVLRSGVISQFRLLGLHTVGLSWRP